MNSLVISDLVKCIYHLFFLTKCPTPKHRHIEVTTTHLCNVPVLVLLSLLFNLTCQQLFDIPLTYLHLYKNYLLTLVLILAMTLGPSYILIPVSAVSGLVCQIAQIH